MAEPAKPHGLFDSLRQLLATLIETAQVRLALLSNELEHEKLRLFDGLLWAALALLLLGLGVVLLCGFLLVLFWDDHRLLALGVLSLLLLTAGAALLRAARQRLRTPGGLFMTSVKELARDRDGLTPRQ